MIDYSLEMVVRVLKEVCKKFALTKDIHIREVKYDKEKLYYLITLNDNTQRILPQELINQYIESFSERGGLEIAGHLRHDIELEQSAFSGKGPGPDSDETWDGDVQDAIDYINEKEEKEEGKEKE